MTETISEMPSQRPGRISRVKKLFKDHPILGPVGTGAGFVLGAVVSTLVGAVVEQRLNNEAIEAADLQQQQIVAGTAEVQKGVADLKASLATIRDQGQGADLDAFQLSAERLVADLTGVVPVIEKAALSNANLIGRLRAEALSRPDGATTTAAFELPRNGSATICRDFTVAVPTNGTDSVYLRLSRRGDRGTWSGSNSEAGDTVVLRQADASASVTLAGYGRGANGDLIGIDYNCFEGTGD